MKATIINHIKHTKQHLCASGSLLLPLAQKWGLVRIAICCILAAFALPFIVTSDKAHATNLTLTLSDGSTLTVGDFSAAGTSAGTSSSTNVFGEASGIIAVGSNAYFGYELTISPKNSGDNALKNGSNRIESITATNGITENDFKSNVSYNNMWGYQPSKRNGIDNNKFFPGPTTSEVIEKTTGGEKWSSIGYVIVLGAKIDSTLPRGTYANTFVVAVTANEVDYTITYNDNGGLGGPGKVPGKSTEPNIKLSDITPTRDEYDFVGWCSVSTNGRNCNGKTYQPGDEYTLTGNTSNITLYAMWSLQEPVECQLLKEVGDTGTLTDKRGGTTQTYTIRRLADGRCWMVENLRLGGNNPITLTDKDTDLNDGVTEFTLPISSKSGFRDYDVANVYVSTINSDEENVEYGGYYTWYAATAGTGTQSMSSNATSSICPKNWKLPTSGNGGEFQILLNQYNSQTLMTNDDGPHFLLAGFYFSGSVVKPDSYGRYWSSTVYSSNYNYAFNLALDTSSVNVTSINDKYYGESVRCVARGLSSMQKVSEWGDLVKEGDTVTAIDERDGKTYTVARLNDGKLWMTQNLAIGSNEKETILYSSDTDISSGSFKLPQGGTAPGVPDGDKGWNNDQYNTANIYIDHSQNSGFYTWFAATAGEGTGDKESAETSSSICPKNWKLPSQAEFETLLQYYDYTAFLQAPINYQFAGSCAQEGCPMDESAGGFLWSSTAADDYNLAYNLWFSGITLETVKDSKGLGRSVRCVARE